jgi:hypothetical protein
MNQRAFLVILFALLGSSSLLAQHPDVFVCRGCSKVIQYTLPEGTCCYPPPGRKLNYGDCPEFVFEGHLWYLAGSAGQNRFKCTACGARVSIAEEEPVGLLLADQACHRKAYHKWVRID